MTSRFAHTGALPTDLFIGRVYAGFRRCIDGHASPNCSSPIRTFSVIGGHQQASGLIPPLSYQRAFPCAAGLTRMIDFRLYDKVDFDRNRVTSARQKVSVMETA